MARKKKSRKKPVPRHVALKRLFKAAGANPPKGVTEHTKELIREAAIEEGANIGLGGAQGKKERDERIEEYIDFFGKKRRRKVK